MSEGSDTIYEYTFCEYLTMLTQSSEYALRGLICLTQHGADKVPMSRTAVADFTGIPARYLSKILSDLVRAGLLLSSRGPGGGFLLARSPDEIFLSQAVIPFEPVVGQRQCPFGNTECSDENPCLAHTQWKAILLMQQDFLDKTSLSEVAGTDQDAADQKDDTTPITF